MRISDWSSDVCSSDLSGPLNADGTIAARITGAYENSDSFVDFWHKTHGFVAPVIAFRPGPDTKITLEGLWSQGRWSAFYNGLPAEGTVLQIGRAAWRERVWQYV